MELKRRKISTGAEKKIITGMIVSTKFLEGILPNLNFDHFESHFLRTLAGWCIDFYDHYQCAPFNHIQDIFENRQRELAEEEVPLVEGILTELSQRYELDKGLNVDYYLDEAEKFFREKELWITKSNVEYYLEKGKVEDAEAELEKYHRVVRDTSPWVNPFSKEQVDKTFAHKEEGGLLKFPGQLGLFLGDFHPGWLVGIEGAFKRGKTWMLQEFGLLGTLAKRKVAFFSLEMKQVEMNNRIYKRLISHPEEGGLVTYPTFDCQHNQTGTCELPERSNAVTLYEEGEAKPNYDPASHYRPCTYCRQNNRWDNYEPATWFTQMQRPAYEYETVAKYMDHMDKVFGRYLRTVSFPRFSANYSDLCRALDQLEFSESFVPEIIIVDYADILAPESKSLEGVQKEDRTWMALARLGQERNSLVVTGTQITKEGQEAANIKVSHTGRWVGKLGHVDVMLTLNQLETEKRQGVMRVGIKDHRHREAFSEDYCTVLQQISLGQVHLDSQL